MIVNRKRATTIVAGSIAAGLLVGGSVAAWTGIGSSPEAQAAVVSPKDLPDPPPSPTAPPKPGDDLKIGPWAKDAPAPDLIPIDLEDGRSGFLRTYDLTHDDENSDFMRSTGKNSFEIVLPVYAKDGQTVIGEVVTGTVSSE